jgi:hypothetical protein
MYPEFMFSTENLKDSSNKTMKTIMSKRVNEAMLGRGECWGAHVAMGVQGYSVHTIVYTIVSQPAIPLKWQEHIWQKVDLSSILFDEENVLIKGACARVPFIFF